MTPVSTALPGGEILVVDPSAFISVIDRKGIRRRAGKIGGFLGDAADRFSGEVMQVVTQGDKAVIVMAGRKQGNSVLLFRVRLDGVCN